MQKFASFKALPNNFAQQVLDLEGELDTRCSLSCVKQLLELYSAAVEYFEAIQNSKYLHYTERMRQLLARDDVLFVLQHPDAGPFSSHRQRFDITRKAAAKALGPTRELAADRSAEKEMASHACKSSRVLRKLQENIQSQCSGLNKRVRQRQQKNNSIDWGNARLSFEEYEAQVEATMEWFLEEKQAVKTSIEEKYEEELQELAELGDDSLLDQVIDKMKQKLKEEVRSACELLETEKRRRIAQLRVTLSS